MSHGASHTAQYAGNVLYVAGYGSGAGKSTVCLAIIAHAIRPVDAGGLGVPASGVAYIKPVTQCEAITDVAEFCEHSGVECVPIGPVVFQAGYTNSVISADDYADRRADLLARVVASVTELSRRKALVVVDGVGYPSVGSCCGLGNATVAAALGVPVLLVCNPGLGDCIDTMDLMLTYFKAKGATVTALVVNRFADSKRHLVVDVLPLISKWTSIYAPEAAFLGGIPPVQHPTATDSSLIVASGEFAERLLATVPKTFLEYLRSFVSQQAK
jgi:dethiobiotin synthetase